MAVVDGDRVPEERPVGPTCRTSSVHLVIGIAAVAAVVAVGVVLLRPKPDVAVIGDSITFVSRSAISGELGDDWAVNIDGRPGYTVADQLPAARALAGNDPVQAIVNLGTNDVTADGALQPALDALAEMVAQFPDAECIHLVTVSELIGFDRPDTVERARAFNAGVRELAATDARIRVIDWTTALRDAQAADPGVVLTEDTVHPSPAGQRLLAERYDQALAGCS
jgi:lysophospholipase L1-like esterase